MYQPYSENRDEFAEFFSSQDDISSIEAQFSEIGLPYAEWANDPEWQELASMGIGPIEAIILSSPELAESSHDDIYQMLREQAYEMQPEEMAEWWKKIRRGIAKVAARVVKPLAVAGGTALGTYFGAPALGNKLGRALGGFASRGLTRLSKKGDAKQIRQQINRGINTARTRVSQGKPVFNQQQVSGAIAQLQQLLSNPQIAALLGQREGYYGDGAGQYISEDSLYEVVGDILDAADSLEAALSEGAYEESAPQYYEAAPLPYQDQFQQPRWRG